MRLTVANFKNAKLYIESRLGGMFAIPNIYRVITAYPIYAEVGFLFHSITDHPMCVYAYKPLEQ